MNTQKLYKSKLGVVNTYDGWKEDAIRCYSSIPSVKLVGFSFDNSLPENWFDRYTRILKLEEVGQEEVS